jgi:hypothetical protein
VSAAPGVLRAVGRGVPWILACGLIGLLVAAAGLRFVPPEHTAQMVVGPTSIRGPAAMGVEAPLERLAARSDALPAEDVSDFTRYLHLLTSNTVARRLLTDDWLMRSLFPARWDASSARWAAPSGATEWGRRALLALAGRDDWVEPDAEAVSRALAARLIVEPVGTTALRRVRLRHPDPAVALRLLTAVAAAADAQLRDEARRRLASQIGYLRERLAGVAAADARRALAELLAEQERTALLVGLDLPFAADPVEPPAVSARPDWPDAPILLLAFAAAGVAIAAFAAGARSGFAATRGSGS